MKILKTTSSKDIENIAKFYGLKLNGVYSKDQLPKEINNGCYVVNMQDHNKGNGTHWVCFFKSKHSMYFDSFGLLPPQQIDKALGNYEYNCEQIQSYKSDACGYYCLAVLILLKNGMSYNDIIKIFSNDKEKNEHKLETLFKSYLKK